MRTSNPAFSESLLSHHEGLNSGSTAMTVSGAANKSLVLCGLAMGTAIIVWSKVTGGDLAVAIPLVMGGLVVSLVASLVLWFAPSWSPVLAPVYALSEGALLGAISGVVDMKYPGIALQAVCATFGTLFGMLFLYQSGIIRASQKFVLGVTAATMGIALVYLVSFVAQFFFQVQIPLVHSSGWMGIAFSVVVVVVAALNLILDFAAIENLAAERAPKYMEWYAAYGLLLTIVWLYLEILKLLMKLSDRRDD